MPIERDWWWDTNWCHPRRREVFAVRCFSPSEIANITQPSRVSLGTTGILLMYGHDKVSGYGPPVEFKSFGDRAFKLILPTNVVYTIRNAAEQFMAASAPAGFYGNAYSTFSKGVALMRAGSLHSGSLASRRSFAYDCALATHDTWIPHTSVVDSHPGFHLLEALRPERC
mmetsp:Transcript_26517/g.60017  ORF Transcript_26517/g.60017 Transcript_26517/m.60017 type:complete len:170 (-) Transcript_26517:341-850(-)